MANPQHTPTPIDLPAKTAAAPGLPPGQDIEWTLSNELQSTLDLRRLLVIFQQRLQLMLGASFLSYRNIEAEAEHEIGKPARHSCQYALRLGLQPLGDLTVARGRRFSEDELHTVEKLLCLLLYPIRNALLYRQALLSARRDPLTGALNRGAMDEMLKHEIEVCERSGANLSMLVLDIDHFKAINDGFGHNAGDAALKALVRLVSGAVRGADCLFRYGGEEFTLIMSNTPLNGALLLAERLRQAIENASLRFEGHSISFTASFGVAELQSGENAEQLFRRCDGALYQSKNSGRNLITSA